MLKKSSQTNHDRSRSPSHHQRYSPEDTSYGDRRDHRRRFSPLITVMNKEIHLDIGDNPLKAPVLVVVIVVGHNLGLLKRPIS